MKISFDELNKFWTFPLEINENDFNIYSQKNFFGNKVKVFETYSLFKKMSIDDKRKLVEKINKPFISNKKHNSSYSFYSCDFEKIFYKGEPFFKIRGWGMLTSNNLSSEMALDYEQSILEYVTSQLNNPN